MRRMTPVMMCLSTAALGLALGIGLTLSLPHVTVDMLMRMVMGLILLLAIVAVFSRPAQPMRAGAARKMDRMDVQPSASGLDFSAVAANELALRSLRELVDYLKEPEKYTKFGARMPAGVLLYGPPGTGKTLLAKALAGEAGVPFYALSGSDFVQMYVGVGASRVRELFQKARKAGRCVIFIDEIDSMAKRRDDSSSEERDQTLNALLAEMSGFHGREGVIVVGATNRLDTLDPALLRPGRFDRQIEVGLPGRDERLSILRLHSKNKPLSASVDMDALAHDTAMFSGASLESLLNEAAIRAARRGAEEIGESDIRQAYLSVVAGDDKMSIATGAERLTIALHEAGHALATRVLMPESRLSRVSILPTGRGAAGYSLAVPKERAVMMKSALEHQLQILLAGRAAELLIGGADELTAGASNDLQRAAELAGAMVLDLGMENSPAVAIRALKNACGGGSDAFAQCEAVLNRSFEQVTALLAERSDQLMRLVEALIEKEALDAEEIERALIA